MKLNLLAVIAIAATAIADDYTLQSLKTIHDATVSFNKTLADWDGGYLSGLSILKQSRDLLNSLKAAQNPPPGATHTDTVGPYNAETEDQAFVVANQLTKAVGDAVDTAIGMKPRLEALNRLGKPATLYVFQNLHGAASNLGTVMKPMAAEGRQQDAHDLVDQIEGHFQRGISAYQS